MISRVALALALAGITPALASAQDNSPEQTAKKVMSMRGAPCGEIVVVVEDPKNGNIVAECSNGMVYAIIKVPDGSGHRVLTRRNSLTGLFDVY